MADTNFVVEMKNSDVKAENSDTEEQKSNSESDGQESAWIRKIRSGLKARSGQNAGGDVPIKKLAAPLRKPVACYTPQQWQFGLHNRDPQASSSESEVLKISLAAACKLNSDDAWDEFCADVVDNPADMMLKSYGIYSSVPELSPKESQYLLTLDALTLVLVLSSSRRMPRSERDLFMGWLVPGGFNIAALVKYGVAYCRFLDDLYLCENQIPMALMKKAIMALMKKAISKCYGLLPEESRPLRLRELGNPDCNVTKKLLDRILKSVTIVMCTMFFAEPFHKKRELVWNLIDVNYEVGELENCAHVFACVHKVITTCMQSTTPDKADTELFAPDVHQQSESHLTVGTPPIAVTTTFGRAKQFFATCSKKLASVIATIFRFSTETATEEAFSYFEVIQSATDLKKAGLQIKGIPGMVNEVAFKDSCLYLPIMSQVCDIESYIFNMAAYEYWSTSPPFPFMDYVLLLSQLIKTPEDVSYLVDCDVIRTHLGTQQSIFQMWERLQIGIWYPPYSNQYRVDIVDPINRHCASALNKMRFEFYDTFCSKPWLLISVISAIILLVATLIQTYVLVTGSYKMQPHYPRGG